ncbi:MAG: hypothetical protein L6R39_007467, partial [Caloplaca ligustica]
MDDLNGINWTPSTSGSIKQKPPPMSQSSYPYTLRPTPPLSRISTPLTVPETKPSTNGIARSNASTPANDSFANLVSFNTVNPNNTISLEEQQRKLQKERARQQQGQPGIRSGQQDDDAWEQLGSGRSTPNPVHPPWKHPATEEASGYGLSKAINKPFAGIDASPRRPPQPPTNGNAPLAGFDNLGVGPANGAGNSQSDGDISGARQLQEPGRSSASEVREGATTDDDDPFGLGAMPRHSQSTKPVNQETTNGDDDILGLLGRPVSEFSPPPEPTPPSTDRPKVESPSPADRALAELVDMGFAPEKSRQALEFTESGTDVQAAVGWLLNQAHHESKSNSRGGTSQTRQDRRAQRSPPRQRSPAAKGAQPAWMRDPADRNALQSRQSSRSPVNGEKDPSKIAAELGNNLFKTANSLWKTGTKKLNQAVSELNSDSDSSQPKWMRQPRVRDQSARKTQPQQNRDTDGYGTSANPQQPTPNPNIEVTDEALMLECADARPAPRMLPRPKSDTKPDERKSQQAFPVTETSGENIPQPRFMQQSRPHRREDPKSRLSKQAIEEQTAEAYISPARRKKTTRKPPSPEPDLLFQSSEPPPNTSLPSTAQEPPPLRHPPPQPTRTPQAPKPQAPARTIPAISPSALQTSHTCRRAGTAAFKLGNYSLATTHYTSALSPLPSTHTLRVPLLANRALSYLKTGDPKACLADTQAALDLIGPSRGVGETVDLGDGEGRKD